MISIKSVTIKNFRNFKESEAVFDQSAGVFFISGNNGGGKTTFLNAINWCLYGDIVFHGVRPTSSVRPDWAEEDTVTHHGVVITSTKIRRFVPRHG